MNRSSYSLPALLATLLLAVAIFGYRAGHHGLPAASGERTRLAYGVTVVLDYPSSWRPAASAPPVPGLSLVHPLLLAPGGDSTRAGLISGQLPGGETGPLPRRLLALTSESPRTTIADFLNVQAYSYHRLRLRGYDRTLDLFIIPSPGSNATALACYASPGQSAYLSACERIVARLTLADQSRYDLTPDAGYAHKLGSLIAGLDSERLGLRREMRHRARTAGQAPLAMRLADRFGSVAGAVRLLEPPAVAASAQAALVGSMRRAAETYRTLSTAAASGSATDYLAARAQLDTAELRVDRALQTFALLGYGP